MLTKTSLRYLLHGSLLSLLGVLSLGARNEPMPHPGSPYQLTKRFISSPEAPLERSTAPVVWAPQKTAVIVCDVWDYHHSINAVRRLEEMLPRMELLLNECRKNGSIIIHAPSDCMPAYAGTPARKRAEGAPKKDLPAEIASWCCKINAEQDASYPLDQSDGGEDDDAAEHASWATKLRELGRNPAMPWKTQSPALTIDQDKDYISDRGDEVWAILQTHRIEHVILVGVHANMCVLGRPFGLRQLVRNGMDVVLVRDLTDCMYSPKRWPFVDHFTGNDLLIAYVEQHICPTISSDQILAGDPVRFREDHRPKRDLLPSEVPSLQTAKPQWKLVTLQDQAKLATISGNSEKTWLRCALRFPTDSLKTPALLKASERVQNAWLNGHRLELKEKSAPYSTFEIRKEQTWGNDDANVLVLECILASDSVADFRPPVVMTIHGESVLAGRWQCFDDSTKPETNIPLPAKFGLSPEIYHSVR